MCGCSVAPDAVILGCTTGGMLVTDPAFVNPAIVDWMPKGGGVDDKGMAVIPDTLYWASHIVGALLVLAVGKLVLSRRAAAAGPAEQQG